MNVVIECEVLTYDELPSKDQARLLHKEFENVREMWEYDFLLDKFKETLAEVGFMGADILFSGFGNQGDGLCFDAKVDLPKLCKHLGIVYDESDGWECSIIVVNNNYVHERTRVVYSESVREDILCQMESLRLKFCREFYKELEDDVNLQSGKEALLESLRSRNYVFGSEIGNKLAVLSTTEMVEIL